MIAGIATYTSNHAFIIASYIHTMLAIAIYMVVYIHYSTTDENSDILNSDQTVEVCIWKLAIKIPNTVVG